LREKLGLELDRLQNDLIHKSGKTPQEMADDPTREIVELYMISCILDDICNFVDVEFLFND